MSLLFRPTVIGLNVANISCIPHECRGIGHVWASRMGSFVQVLYRRRMCTYRTLTTLQEIGGITLLYSKASMTTLNTPNWETH
jgi:hypothetical protein